MDTTLHQALFSKYAGSRRRRSLSCRAFLKWGCRFIRRLTGADRAAIVLFEPSGQSILLEVSEGPLSSAAACPESASAAPRFAGLAFGEGLRADDEDSRRLHDLFHLPGRWTEILIHGRPAGLLFCGARKSGSDSACQMVLDHYADDLAAVLEKEDFYDSGGQDFLTGLLDRSVLEKRMDRIVQRCSVLDVCLGVILMEVEAGIPVSGFQQHLVEDQVMRHAGTCIRTGLRQTDLSFRYTQDQFLALVPMVPRDPARRINAAESRRLVSGIAQRLGERLTERPVYCHGLCLDLESRHETAVLEPRQNANSAGVLKNIGKHMTSPQDSGTLLQRVFAGYR